MNRRTLLSRGLFLMAIAAVMMSLILFKVRVGVAGGKYALALVAIVVAVWVLSRGLQRKP